MFLGAIFVWNRTVDSIEELQRLAHQRKCTAFSGHSSLIQNQLAFLLGFLTLPIGQSHHKVGYGMLKVYHANCQDISRRSQVSENSPRCCCLQCTWMLILDQTRKALYGELLRRLNLDVDYIIQI